MEPIEYLSAKSPVNRSEIIREPEGYLPELAFAPVS